MNDIISKKFAQRKLSAKQKKWSFLKNARFNSWKLIYFPYRPFKKAIYKTINFYPLSLFLSLLFQAYSDLPVPSQLTQLLNPSPQHRGHSSHSLSPATSLHVPPVPSQFQHFSFPLPPQLRHKPLISSPRVLMNTGF